MKAERFPVRLDGSFYNKSSFITVIRILEVGFAVCGAAFLMNGMIAGQESVGVEIVMAQLQP